MDFPNFFYYEDDEVVGEVIEKTREDDKEIEKKGLMIYC